MTNAEKILADNPILAGSNLFDIVAKSDGKPVLCYAIHCSECDFCNPNGICVGRNVSWLNSQIKEEDMIADSGERTTYANGFNRDMGDTKGRMDLLPWLAIREVSIHCEEGAKKYGERNIDKGCPQWSLYSSAARHLSKAIEPVPTDPEDTLTHLRAAAWNILWALQQYAKDKPNATRVCDCCGKEMTEGYCVYDGLEYYCSDECLRRTYARGEYEEMCKNGVAYWTEWEE